MVDRYDVALYHTFDDHQKNEWFLLSYNKPYEAIDESFRNQMIQASHAVYAYLHADDKKKEELWHEYDFFTRCLCNGSRWQDEFHKEQQIEKYTQKLFPKSDITIIIK